MTETYKTPVNEIHSTVTSEFRQLNTVKSAEGSYLSTRLATEKDFEAIWNLYLRTNFLYPEKLTAMQDNGKKAKDNLQKLLSLNSEFFQICMCENQASELMAVCTHAQYSAAHNHVMHLASNGNIKELLKIFKANQKISFNCSADFTSYTFRPNNAGVKRLFTSVLNNIEVDFENQIYDYYKFSIANLSSFKASSKGFQIQDADEADSLYLIENSPDKTQRVVLNSIGKIEDATILAVSKVFNSIGLVRHRKVFSIKKDGVLQGIAVVEIGPDWWNFSGLGTGIRLFSLNEDEQIAQSLLTVATEFLSDFPIACWTMLVSPNQIGLTKVLHKLGFQSPKKYQRISVPKSVTQFACNKYNSFIERQRGDF